MMGIIVEKILHFILVQIHFAYVVIHHIVVDVMFTLFTVGGGNLFIRSIAGHGNAPCQITK